MLENLRTLHLRNNRIKLLWPKCFQGLKNLEEIDLTSNHIKTSDQVPVQGYLEAQETSTRPEPDKRYVFICSLLLLVRILFWDRKNNNLAFKIFNQMWI